jgi:hypothetical protein
MILICPVTGYSWDGEGSVVLHTLSPKELLSFQLSKFNFDYNFILVSHLIVTLLS